MREILREDLAEVGIPSGIHQAKVIGMWRNLQDNYDRCQEAESLE
jgi:hypothetical protein